MVFTVNSKVIILETLTEISEWFAGYLTKELNSSPNYFHLAISGGSTPKFLFDYLSLHYQNKIEWEKIKLFWVDERCVPPEHQDSNYKMAFDHLISKVNFAQANIFRIQGELNPELEAINYSQRMKHNVPLFNNLPRFDLILLGLGEDGHVASIFPGNLNLFKADNFCSVTCHPVIKQRRITINGNVINNANSIIFLVTGSNKALIFDAVINKRNDFIKLPAASVNPANGNLIWLVDSNTANLLKHRP